MAACKNLELLRIAANQFKELPAWLLEMPRLSWLSYSGNPFCAEHEAWALVDAPVALVPWDRLTLKHKLGEGASGVIYQGSVRDDGDVADVAVKLFKGELTSDGLPYSEMAACMRAGAHPNLITVQGKIDLHPEGQAGLVMSLVGSHYRNLAGPPSLESCTRDVYAPEMRFSLSEALRIAVDMASVAEQLHANGIMHGDFYAHNILVEDAGHALLGDFGAACFVSDTNAKQARGLERIEVRAFGCLLEELLERVGAAPESATREIPTQETAIPETTIQETAIQNELVILRDRCLNTDVKQRPSFQEIVFLLKQQAVVQ
jgi:serine/threonine protein kinase